MNSATPLNVKYKQVEALASRVSEATGEAKTEAIRKGSAERTDQLGLQPTAVRMVELELKPCAIHAEQRFELDTNEDWDSHEPFRREPTRIERISCRFFA